MMKLCGLLILVWAQAHANSPACLEKLKTLAGPSRTFTLVETGMDDGKPMTIAMTDVNVDQGSLNAQGIKSGQVFKVPIIGFKIDGTFKIKKCILKKDFMTFSIVSAADEREVEISQNKTGFDTRSSLGFFDWSSTFQLSK